MKHLIPTLLIALSLIGVGCKARKVALHKTDSVVTSASSATVHTETARKDSVTTKTTTNTKTTDNSTSTVTIVPDSGHIITVSTDKGFIFTGRAKIISYIGHKNIVDTTHMTSNSLWQSKTFQVHDSTAQSQSKTEVHKKDKVVESKPSYRWMVWVAGILAVIGGLYFVSKKLKFW